MVVLTITLHHQTVTQRLHNKRLTLEEMIAHLGTQTRWISQMTIFHSSQNGLNEYEII